MSKIILFFLFLLIFSIFPLFGAEPGLYDKIGIDVKHGLHGAVPEENIDLFTGNLTLRNLDIQLPGPNGFDLKIWRVYNSKIVQDRLATSGWAVQQEPYSYVGIGWSMHMGRIHNYESTEPVIEFPDGRWETAYPNVNGSDYITRDFLKYDNIDHKLWFKDGTVWTFGAMANLNMGWGNMKPVRVVTRIENSHGHHIDIEYNGIGSPDLKKITDSMGRVVNFSISNSKLTQVTLKDENGSTVTYRYTVDEFNGDFHRLSRFEPPEIPAVTYEYQDGLNSDWKLLAVDTSYGGRMEYLYEDHTFYYQGLSQATRVVKNKKIRFSPADSFKTWTYTYPTYQGVSEATVVVNGPEYETRVTYNGHTPQDPWKLGLIKKKWFTDGSFSQQTQWEGFKISENDWFVLSIMLDSEITAPLVKKVTTTQYGDATGAEEYLYERSGIKKYGLPSKIKYYGGNSGTDLKNYKTFDYYFESSSTFSNKYMLTPVKYERVFNAGNSKLKETQTNYYISGSSCGAIDWVKRWRGDTTLTWEYTYSGSNPNNITITIDFPGNEAGLETYKYSYGVLSEKKQATYTEFTRVISSYNSVIKSETNQHGGVMNFTYDNLGRIERIDLPSGFNDITASWSTNSVTINQGSNSMVKYWDGMGRDTGYTESGDGTTLYYRKTLDDEGRVVSENKGSTSVSDTYNYVLDSAGRMTRITDPRNKETNILYSGTTKTVTDAENHKNYFYFTGLPGLFTSMKDAAGKTATYTYDPIGRLTGVVYSGTRFQQYGYNGLDQVTSESHPETGEISYIYNTSNQLDYKRWDNKNIFYTYTQSNQIKTVNDGDELITYEYDTKGRLQEVSSNQGWYRDQFQYNLLGSLTNERQYIPGLGAKILSYDYDNNNNLKKINYPDGDTWVNITNNGLNMPESVSYVGNQLVSSVTYDSQKQPSYINIIDNGTIFTAQYGPSGLLDNAKLKKGGTTLYNVDYGYDNVGNVKSFTDTVPSLNANFIYDSRYRLTNAGYSGGTSNSYVYGYDDYGNLKTARVNGALVFNRTYTTNNRISGADYDYDGRGNMTKAPGYIYNWDKRNRLTSIQKQTGETTSVHLYNEAGLRMKSSRVAATSLAITFPAGGETFNRGSVCGITWTTGGILDNDVKFTLMQSGSEFQTIISSTPNNGLYNWVIPASLGDGEYTIRIESIDGTVSAESNSFFVSGTLTMGSFSLVENSAVTAENTASAGCEWGDYNNDGFPDLYVTNYNQYNALFKNNSGSSFSKISRYEHDTGSDNSEDAAWGDFDNNGLLDLYTANYNENNKLFKYTGLQDSFQQVTGQIAVGDLGNSQKTLWLDYDKDGWLDLSVINHYQPNFLYRGTSSGIFTKVSGSTIVSDIEYSRGGGWCDYDNNGWPDLFVTNYDSNNSLYKNVNGTFIKIIGSPATSDSGKSWSCAWGDYNNDGHMDLYVCNRDGENNFLYRNDGSGDFVKITQGGPVTQGGDSYACAWGDFDNDGDLDLFVLNANQNNFLYQNDGNGSFTTVSAHPIVTHALDSRAMAWGDYNRDGRLDLFIANYNDNDILFMNEGGGNNWLMVRCEGVVSNKLGIGARIQVRATIGGVDTWQVRELNRETGLFAHFGLGDAAQVTEVVVTWPSGIQQQLSATGANQYLTVVEPSGDNITLLTPNGGDVLVVDDTYEITWASNGAVGDVDIEYSTDSGSTWTLIAAAQANDGGYTWTVPDTTSSQCKVKITESGGTLSDESNGLFTISVTPQESITVTSPVGGESWLQSSVHAITWDYQGSFSAVKIDYSIDNGASWLPVASSTPNDGSHDWTLPDVISSYCLVRVRDLDGTPSDTSGVFSIVSNIPTYIEVHDPDGGESIVAGTVYQVKWNKSPDINDVRIEYTIDGGATWTEIGTATKYDGSIYWTVPNAPSTQCRVKVSELDGSPSDTSDDFFTITSDNPPYIEVHAPNDPEDLVAGTEYQIKWNKSPDINDVRIEYTIDDGATWTEIGTKTKYDASIWWTIPNTPSHLCLVRVSELDGSPSDISDFYFTIHPPPSLAITSPNGGEGLVMGEYHEITWTYEGIVGDVKIEYSTDDGQSWNGITASVPNTGTYSWLVPDQLSSTCRIRVAETDDDPSDISDAAFSIVLPPVITVTSPNGGENWEVGSSHTITWTSEGNISDVAIHYSSNGGNTWQTVIASTPNEGSFSWTLPDDASVHCLVRVQDTDGKPSDTSNKEFTITLPSSITITAPNGGESWPALTSQSITWTNSGGASLVDIRYSSDGGASWQNVATDTANDGTFEWTVPHTPSNHCLVQILPAHDDTGPADVSDREFSILADTALCGAQWRNGDFSGEALYGLAYGANGIDLFTAVGDNGAIATSDDGIRWTSQTTAITDHLRAVAFGENRFVTVGLGGAIFTSPDGTAWTARSAGTGNDLRGIAYGNHRFVTLGASGTLLTSTDGITWTARTSPTTNDLRGVAYGGGRYVAVGLNGTILSSTDGSSWTLQDSGGTASLRAVAYSPDSETFIVAGGNDTVLISSDGVNWESVAFTNDNWLVGVAYGNFQWQIVGADGKIFSANDYDTQTWTARSSGTVNTLNAVLYMNERFVAAGAQISLYSLCGPGEPVITMSSPNGGETWRVGATQTVSWDSFGVAGNVAIDYSSDNGGTWTTVTASAPNSGNFDWLIPDTPSTTCLVRISAESGSVSDVSNAIFEISSDAQPVLTLTYPNGGESVNNGDTVNVTWTTSGTVPEIKLEYSANSGVTWTTVAGPVANQDNYDWTVPDTPSDHCLLRITGVTGGSGDFQPMDTCDGVFSILSPQTDTITVTSPNGGESWDSGSTQSVTWTSTGTVGPVDIHYSSDGGSSWSQVVNGAANSGSHDWLVPDVSSQRCLLRVSESSVDEGPSDISDGPFTMVSPGTASITLTSPIGGETWTVGESRAITWNSTSTAGTVNIDCSIDNGSTWSVVAASQPDSGSYLWTVPDTPSVQCLVRVSDDVAVNPVSDQGGAVFTIAEAPTLTLTAPNGGESWQAGSFMDITWTSTGTPGALTIQYSTDGGTVWHLIASAVQDTGTYSWLVPDTPSADCRVKISAQGYGEEVNDVSDTAFTITTPAQPVIIVLTPNGGESLMVGETALVTWATAGTLDTVTLEYSTDDGTAWTQIIADTENTGTYTWTVPDSPSTQCLLRVTGDGGTPMDVSDGVFEIISPPAESLTLTSPNGGESLEVGTVHTITWSHTGVIDSVALFYSTDNGQGWTAIINQTANTGSFDWTVPDTPSDTCLVRINKDDNDRQPSDTSDGVFTISSDTPSLTLISPNGGEGYTAGDGVTISWMTVGTVDLVTLEYSINNGASWQQIADGLTNTGAYDWTIPDLPSDACLLRVSNSDNDGVPQDVSDGVFTILAQTPDCGMVWASAYSGSQSFNGVTYGGTGFVAVGDSGALYSSTSGKSWKAEVSGVTESLNGVAFGDDLYVVAGDSGTIFAGSGAADLSAEDSGVSATLNGVAYGKAIFVAAGSGGRLLARTGNNVWTDYSTTNTQDLYDICYGQPGFVAVGASGMILKSTNGYDWTKIAAPTSENLRAVTYAPDGSGLYMAVGDNGVILTSETGSEWSQRDYGKATGFLDVAFGNSTYVITAPLGKVLMSNDTQSWTQASTSVRGDIGSAVYGNGLMVAVGDGLIIYSSCPAASPSASLMSSAHSPLRLISPNGNDVLYAGKPFTIKWKTHEDYSRIDEVKLEYTPDNGSTYFSIADHLPNRGTYEWTVPHDISKTCRLRVSPATGSGLHEYSPAIHPPNLWLEMIFKSPTSNRFHQPITLNLSGLMVRLTHETPDVMQIECDGRISRVTGKTGKQHHVEITWNSATNQASLWLDKHLVFDGVDISPILPSRPALEIKGLTIARVRVAVSNQGSSGFSLLFDELFNSKPGQMSISKDIGLPANLLFDVSDKCFEISFNNGMVDEPSISISRSSSPSHKGPYDDGSHQFRPAEKPVRTVPVGQDALNSVGMTDTYYIYSFDGKLMAEYSHTGSVTKNYIYLGDRLLAEYYHQGGGFKYYISDTHRSTRIITDDSGTVVYSAAYDPYGNIQKTWANTYNPKLKFSGKEREDYSGLDYFGGRYYDSGTFRFNSVDPVITKTEAIVNPQLWNLYSYCKNNPTTFYDPDGKIAIVATATGVAVAVVGAKALGAAFRKMITALKGVSHAQMVSSGVASSTIKGYAPSADMNNTSDGGESGGGSPKAPKTPKKRPGLIKRILKGQKYPDKMNRGGKMQPYNPANGRYLKYADNLSIIEKDQTIQTVIGTVEGLAVGVFGGQLTPAVSAARTKGQQIGQMIGTVISNIF